MSKPGPVQPAIVSELLQYLPAIYQDVAWSQESKPPVFLGQFLLAFERILLERPDGQDVAARPGGIPAGPDVREDGQGAFLVSGSAGLERLADLLDFHPADCVESTTIGALLAEWLCRVPKPGEVVERDGIHIEILAADQMRVTEVRISRSRLGPPLEQQIARLHTLFNPAKTRKEFLRWLASWAALHLHADLSEKRKRDLIARIIPLYRIRGTKKYLEELLDMYLEVKALVVEVDSSELRIGVQSTVGVDTYIGGGPPYFFRVTLDASGVRQAAMDEQFALARAVIELAKPAHTAYHLRAIYPAMQIAVRSTVGVDTILVPSSDAPRN